MLNPYVLAGALIAIGASFFFGMKVGDDRAVARQEKQEELIRAVSEASQTAAAGEIAKIEVKNVTIRQQLETEVREKPVYRDCTADQRVLGLINQAITGTEPAGPGQLPGVGSAN